MQTPLEIRLFGPFEVLVDGAPLPRLRSRKGQWLLALLALRHGREVQRSWLAATLWPQSPTPAAFASLRNCLMDLRRALGPHASRLQSPTPHTLALDLTACFVDVNAFDCAIAPERAGNGARTARMNTAKHTDLERAVALYRGPLLEGCDEEWAFPERATRELVCLTTLETLAEAALAAGDRAAAERHLRHTLALDSLRETACRSLMQLLAGIGNDAAALRLYRDLRRRLRDEGDDEPDAETQALAAALSERVGGTGPSPSGRTPPPLPRPPHPLIGRERELGELQELLATARLVTLMGPAGVGKTRLALQTAADLRDDFEDGVYFVDLSTIVDPDLVASAVVGAVGAWAIDGTPLWDGLAAHLQSRQALLVLDNIEQVLPVASRLADLLAAAPELRLLATSRAPLRLTIEHQYPVSPLEEAPAVQLFDQRARRIQPRFVLTDANRATIAAICHHLDGLPLAIELAAARLNLLAPRALLAQIAHSPLPSLTSGPCDRPLRHQSAEGAIRWSYALLSDAEQCLFRSLAVFAGSFTLDAAAAVSDASLDPLASLADQSLLQGETSDGNEAPRFRMLELIRAFARERLQASGEAPAIHRRHADYYLSHARTAAEGAHANRDPAWLDRLEQEHANFRAALGWSLGRGDLALQLAAALARFWELRGHLTEGRAWLSKALAVEAADRDARAWALQGAGNMAAIQGDLDAAQAAYEEALAIWQAMGNRTGVGSILNNMAIVAGFRGDDAMARRLLEEERAICRETGDRHGELDCLINLSWNARRRGEFDRAKALCAEAERMSRELDCPRWAIHEALGEFAMRDGDLDGARRHYGDGLALSRRTGDPRVTSAMLENLGQVARAEGARSAAATLYRESLILRRRLDLRPGMVRLFERLGELALERADFERAARLFGVADALRDRWRTPVGPLDRSGNANRRAVCREAMADAAFDAAWRRGAAMSLDTAVALAIGDGVAAEATEFPEFAGTRGDASGSIP